jgi:hypothetical protein
MEGGQNRNRESILRIFRIDSELSGARFGNGSEPLPNRSRLDRPNHTVDRARALSSFFRTDDRVAVWSAAAGVAGTRSGTDAGTSSPTSAIVLTTMDTCEFETRR